MMALTIKSMLNVDSLVNRSWRCVSYTVYLPVGVETQGGALWNTLFNHCCVKLQHWSMTKIQTNPFSV